MKPIASDVRDVAGHRDGKGARLDGRAKPVAGDARDEVGRTGAGS